MWLVHRGKQNPNRWEVAWTWAPFFLASDQLLVKRVDKLLTEEWKGTENPGLDEIRKMHRRVIEIICERYPIQGLSEYLSAIREVSIEEGTEPRPAQRTSS